MPDRLIGPRTQWQTQSEVSITAKLEPLGVTRRDAATVLGISLSTVKKMESVGKLKTYRVGANNYGVRVTMQSIRDQAANSKR